MSKRVDDAVFRMPINDCFRVGMSGNCGVDCCVFQDGLCENFWKVARDHFGDLTDIEIYDYLDLYGEDELELIKRGLK